MKVIAVIVSHNRLKLLQDCIQSLLTGSQIPNEIIVVDNDSKDGTQEWLETQSSLTSHCLNHNHGGSFGFTYGMKKALEMDADWIWTMDEDVLVSSDCLEKLMDHHGRNPELDFLVPLVVNPKGISNPNSAPIVNSKGMVETATFIGTLMHMSCLVQVGYPISNMFRFYDDIEFYWRLVQHGKRGQWVEDAKITHFSEGKSLDQHYASLKNDHWSWMYLRNMYFYLKVKNGFNFLLRKVASDFFRGNKRRFGGGFSRIAVLSAFFKALSFKPEYGTERD